MGELFEINWRELSFKYLFYIVFQELSGSKTLLSCALYSKVGKFPRIYRFTVIV